MWPLLLAVLFMLFRGKARRLKALIGVLAVLIGASLFVSSYVRTARSHSATSVPTPVCGSWRRAHFWP